MVKLLKNTSIDGFAGFQESQGMANISIKETSQEAMLFVLQYMYTDNINVKEATEYIVDVLDLAYRVC